MKFEQAVDIILNFEGGLSNHKKDPGGMTNYGISQRAFPQIDIERLTKNGARAIYKEHYWDKVRGDELPPRLRLMVFDTAVNMGVFKAIYMLQEIIRIKPDGKMGPVTIAACKSFLSQGVLDKYTLVRIMLYTKIGTFRVFGNGWIWRVLEVYKFSIMADFGIDGDGKAPNEGNKNGSENNGDVANETGHKVH